MFQSGWCYIYLSMRTENRHAGTDVEVPWEPQLTVRPMSEGNNPDASSSSLTDLLRAARDREGSMAAVARKIGITTSRYARAMKGEYSLDTLNALRFAKAMGLGPLSVLRAAGKTEIADLLAYFFERDEGLPSPTLTPQDHATYNAWHCLPVEVQDTIRALIHTTATSVPRDHRRRHHHHQRPERRRGNGGD